MSDIHSLSMRYKISPTLSLSLSLSLTHTHSLSLSKSDGKPEMQKSVFKTFFFQKKTEQDQMMIFFQIAKTRRQSYKINFVLKKTKLV